MRRSEMGRLALMVTGRSWDRWLGSDTSMSWTVKSAMTTEVVTVPPATAYKEVIERMPQRQVSAVPVVDPDRRVIGVVSEMDLLLKEERPPLRPGGALIDPMATRRRRRRATPLRS